MSRPGWYPDPAGVPQRLRFWDGTAWTSQIVDAGPAGGRRAGRGWIGAAVAAVAVLVVVIALVFGGSRKPILGAPEEPTSSPTISSWNESDSPTPTPTPTPPKGRPSPRITQLRCDQEGPPRTSVSWGQSGSRFAVGAISMPTPPASWEGPRNQNLVRYGEPGYGYLHGIEPGWMNSMVIGPTNFATSASLETQARTIIACLGGTSLMRRYIAPSSLRVTTRTVSGRPAVEADAVYSWDYPDLASRGSLIRVVVVDTSDGPYYFMGEATKERPDMIAVLNELSAGLQAR